MRLVVIAVPAPREAVHHVLVARPGDTFHREDAGEHDGDGGERRHAPGLRQDVALGDTFLLFDGTECSVRDFNRNGLTQRESRYLQDRIHQIRSRLTYERRDNDGRRW